MLGGASCVLGVKDGHQPVALQGSTGGTISHIEASSGFVCVWWRMRAHMQPSSGAPPGPQCAMVSFAPYLPFLQRSGALCLKTEGNLYRYMLWPTRCCWKRKTLCSSTNSSTSGDADSDRGLKEEIGVRRPQWFKSQISGDSYQLHVLI